MNFQPKGKGRAKRNPEKYETTINVLNSKCEITTLTLPHQEGGACSAAPNYTLSPGGRGIG
jgi:hypothetical protein